MDTCLVSPTAFEQENNVEFPNPDLRRWEEGEFSDSRGVNGVERAGAARLRVLRP